MQYSSMRTRLPCQIPIIGIRAVAFYISLVAGIFPSACTSEPNHTRIWYSWDNSQVAEIRVIDASTKQQQTMTQADFVGSHPKISPDGKYISYIRTSLHGESVWILNSKGSNPRSVTSDAEWAGHFWLDDNSLVVTTNDEIPDFRFNPLKFNLYSVSTGQSRPVSVEEYRPDQSAWNKSSIHPERIVTLIDSKHVASKHFELNDGSIKSVDDYTISLASLPDIVFPCCFSWTPDGRKTVFQARNNLRRDIYDLFLSSDNGRSVATLTNFGKDLDYATVKSSAISPDGKWVCAIASLGQIDLRSNPYLYDILLINTEQDNVYFLSRQTFYCTADCFLSLIWSPDNHYVATAWSPTGVIAEQEIFIIDVQTRQVKQLTSDGGVKRVFDWR